MKKSKTIMLFILLAFSFTVNAQNKFTISGYVKDSQTGEALIGASVYIKELTTTGTSTNAYGFYSLTVPEGSYTVSSQFIGYEVISVRIELKQSIKHDFILS